MPYSSVQWWCLWPRRLAEGRCVPGRVLQDEETEGWTDTLEHYSYYPEAQLRPVMCQLASLVVKANEKLGDSRAKRVVSALSAELGPEYLKC